ncbi:hypothetical protein GC176_16565 [bacterium]|nr:hypothetical protein [bacterium]
MLFEFLTSDDFLFWAILAVQSALIIWFVEAGSAVAAGTMLASIAVTVSLFPSQWSYFGVPDVESTGVNNWLLENAWRLPAAAGCYVLVGLLWSTFRWWLFVNDARDAYDAQKKQWLQPLTLLSSARLLEERAVSVNDERLRVRYLHWARACRSAATAGGCRLSPELKPVWKDFVENGYRC